ncbi:MAG: Ig-like domain-containing protein [Bacteroidales bacterium]
MKLKPSGYSAIIRLRQGRVPGMMNIMVCAGVLTLLLGCISCSKEKDDKNPVVEIELPLENQTFTIGDSIRVKGWASDETALKSVQVTITDMNFIVRD